MKKGYLAESSRLRSGARVSTRILVIRGAIAVASENDDTKDFRHFRGFDWRRVADGQ